MIMVIWISCVVLQMFEYGVVSAYWLFRMSDDGGRTCATYPTRCCDGKTGKSILGV